MNISNYKIKKEKKFLCRRCLETKNHFKVFYDKNGIKDYCDFCDKKKIVVDSESLLEFIFEAMLTEYQSTNSPAYDHEMGFHSSNFYEMSELLDMNIYFQTDRVRKYLHSLVSSDETYAVQDPYRIKEIKLKKTWEEFSNIVMYERRFFFPRPAKENLNNTKENGPRNAGDILNYVFTHLKETNVFIRIKKGTKLYRARTCILPKEYSLYDEIILPRKEYALKSNRLSPAGIPIFYGAFTEEHLQKETRHDSKNDYLLGEFIVLQELLILDLTKLKVPSIFLEKNPIKRDITNFLNDFKGEIVKPLKNPKAEHIEYVPSQVFAEFIRHRCKVKNKLVDGIIYPSVFSSSEKNIALFISNDLIVNLQDSTCSKENAALGFEKAKIIQAGTKNKLLKKKRK